MNEGYYPDEDDGVWCEHDEMVWKETEEVYEDGSVVCEGKCPKCDYEEKELLMVDFGDDKLLKKHKVRTIISRGNLTRCCKCNKIVQVPLILMEGSDNPAWQIDLCKRCVRKMDLLKIQI